MKSDIPRYYPWMVSDESVDPCTMDLLGDELKLELIKLKLKLL